MKSMIHSSYPQCADQFLIISAAMVHLCCGHKARNFPTHSQLHHYGLVFQISQKTKDAQIYKCLVRSCCQTHPSASSVNSKQCQAATEGFCAKTYNGKHFPLFQMPPMSARKCLQCFDALQWHELTKRLKQFILFSVSSHLS